MNPSIADKPAGTPGPLMPRAILESPFAAPKALRDALAALRAKATHVDEMHPHARQVRAAALAVHQAEDKHRRYLKALALHVLGLGFAPYASHVYTQWLDDNDPDQRTLGIQAGFAWAQGVQDVFIGTDLGVSAGMELGLKVHRAAGRTIHEVTLGPDWGRSKPRTTRTPIPDAPGGMERP